MLAQAETTTGAYRELMEDLVRRFKTDGQVVKGRADTNPEAWQYGPVDFVVLIDCHPTDPVPSPTGLPVGGATE